MKKILSFLLLITAVATTTFAQTKVGEVTFPNKKQFGSHELVLNGAGMREKLWFDLYAAGLYLNKKNSNASAIASADEKMAIHMVIQSSILSTKKMIGALRDGFEDTNSEATIKKIQPKIDTFISFLKDEINIDDSYTIVYEPAKGCEFFKNEKLLGTLEGMDFKTALFNIWLAKDPVDDDLKNNMLGK